MRRSALVLYLAKLGPRMLPGLFYGTTDCGSCVPENLKERSDTATAMPRRTGVRKKDFCTPMS